ncbi:hypothetical protein [Microlunatus ginsengisoli]|uniref:Permease n=1 Tax=Microlunatus ginsengisoli TaxID=363863 RepID=A0ABP7ACP9_9ACTN
MTENPGEHSAPPAAGSEQATTSQVQPVQPVEDRENVVKVWLRRLVIAIAVLIVAVAVYLILAAFVPRAWAQSIGRQANGRISTGIMLGLIYGGIFTFLPLLLLAQVGRRALSWKVKIGLLIAAVVLAIPNLMTLSIVVGSSNAAHDGQRILSVQAPGFRYATLWGVGLGALIGLAVVAVVIVFERRGDELKLLRARVTDLEAELEQAKPPMRTLIAQEQTAPAQIADTSPPDPSP